MSEPTTCQRHPRTETRLRCSSCEAPICPRCAVDAAIGLRCPACAQPAAGGGLRRRPDQVGRAAVVATTGAIGGGILLALFVAYIGFLSIIASYLVGMQIGRWVRDAAQGNTVDVVRYLGMGGGVASGLVANAVGLVGLGVAIGPYSLLMAAGAGYGAWRAMQ